MQGLEAALPLAASLGIGLLIGVERGWHLRTVAPGTRVAGVRTFTLIGFLGGMSAQLSKDLGPGVLVVAFASLAGLLIASYAVGLRESPRRSATTEVAALVTFVLGACPPLGYGLVAGGAAVIVAFLLSGKGGIHRAVEGLEERELDAALKLLALAFVLMPLLPDRGIGPWGAWNLRAILWMVLLIAGLSFVGYLAVRRVGARLGFGLAALLGGLVSSTAVTLDFARRARAQPDLARLLAAGIVGACGSMFARVLVLVGVLAPALLVHAALPLALATAVCWVGAWWGWRHAPRDGGSQAVRLESPLALGIALPFAALLAFVSLLAAALRAWLGDRGVYALSVVAGLGDVDAITVTLARQTGLGLALPIAAHGILIASAVDTLLKTGLALGLGGRALGRPVALVLAAALLLGAAALLVPALR